MNNISFQGNITVTTWNKAKSSFKMFQTTDAQDKLFRQVTKNIRKSNEYTPIANKKSEFLLRLAEKIIGKPIKRIPNQKVFYKGDDYFVLSDKHPLLFDGIRMEVDFDKAVK